MIVGGVVGPGVVALLGGNMRHGVAEQDEELDVWGEAEI